MRERVFVYGTLKRGHGNYDRFMRRAEFVGEAEVKGYTLVDLGWFPGMIPMPNLKVVGEVYDVSTEDLVMLDRLESGYTRTAVETAPFGTAWAYVLNATRNLDRLRVIGSVWPQATT